MRASSANKVGWFYINQTNFYFMYSKQLLVLISCGAVRIFPVGVG